VFHNSDGRAVAADRPRPDFANSAEADNPSPTRPLLVVIVILCFALAAVLVWAATLGVGHGGSAGG
jgi:hypothetical protein